MLNNCGCCRLSFVLSFVSFVWFCFVGLFMISPFLLPPPLHYRMKRRERRVRRRKLQQMVLQKGRNRQQQQKQQQQQQQQQLLLNWCSAKHFCNSCSSCCWHLFVCCTLLSFILTNYPLLSFIILYYPLLSQIILYFSFIILSS